MALAIGDNPKRLFQAHKLTADWTFVRFHYGRGRKGNYSKAQLNTWARQIKRWPRRVDVYAYFNNDWEDTRRATRSGCSSCSAPGRADQTRRRRGSGCN